MVNKRARAAGVVLGYEAVALLSDGRLPTISAFCEQYPWLSALVITALVVHIPPYRPRHLGERPQVVNLHPAAGLPAATAHVRAHPVA